jgi:hypothetical protein
MQGNQYFGQLALSTSVASATMLLFLRFFGHNLVGVWLSLVVLYSCRLLAVSLHHGYFGPLAPRNLRNRAVVKI